MAITAADVNKLRQQTGAGMMDCKNALVEANGDFETAIDILRKKGQKIAAKRGGNDAKEGLIMAQATADGKAGVILALNCETDFVAKNDGYVAFVQSLVDLALNKLPETAEELKTLAYDDRLSVEEKNHRASWCNRRKTRFICFCSSSRRKRSCLQPPRKPIGYTCWLNSCR